MFERNPQVLGKMPENATLDDDLQNNHFDVFGIWRNKKNVNLHNYPLDANEQKGCKKIRNTSILINWCHFQWVSRALNWTVVFAYILQGLKNTISPWRNMEVMEV